MEASIATPGLAHAEAQGRCKLLPGKAILRGDGLRSLDVRAASDLMRMRGYVLLRGFVGSGQDYEALTRAFASKFRVHGNLNRPFISSDGNTQQVDPGQHALPFHSEMSYGPFYPDTMWFYCVEPSGKGGETTVCDGVAVIRALDPEVRSFLEQHRLEYNHRYPRQSWQRSIGTTSTAIATLKLRAFYLLHRSRGDFSFAFEPDGTMRVRYLTSAFAFNRDGDRSFANSLEISYLPNVQQMRGGGVCLEGGKEVPAYVLEEVARATSEVGHRIPWQANDVLMIDNSRAMHGRVALAPDGRRLFVRLGNRKRRTFP